MNTRRSFIKSLALVPSVLAGAVVVAKTAPKPLWNIDWTCTYTCSDDVCSAVCVLVEEDKLKEIYRDSVLFYPS